MTNRFYSPDQQFISNSGVPYAGGQLFFYATGTSTPQNTYSDQALTTANSNPVILDSNGQAGSIFLQNLAYKVVLLDASNNQIWTMDPVYTSDYSTYAAFQPWNGNPNGQVAGFAGTVGALPPTSAIWDYVDNILYVCTTTGNAASAVWTAVNGSSAAQVVPDPLGYLTLSSDANNPILTSDAISATTVYYTPYLGNLLPIYNGSSFAINTFSQLSLTLSASQAINTIYDVFAFNNSGVITLVVGPAWAVSTAGSGSRGTGAGTTQLQRLNGIWVNAVQITGRNGATTYTIPANTATYLGSIFIDSVAGQVTCHVSIGQNRKWGVWNTYNRQPILIQLADPTSSWSSTVSVGPRFANNSSSNVITTFTGLPEEKIFLNEVQKLQINNVVGLTTGVSTTVATLNVGVGINTTGSFSGKSGVFSAQRTVNSASNFALNDVFIGDGEALAVIQPGIGTNAVNVLEQASASISAGGGITVTWLGSSSNMLASAIYRG